MDKFVLIITARREIESQEQGHTIFDIVKEKLLDHPEIILTGHISNHFTDTEE